MVRSIIDHKILLGTYKLQDPNGRELAVLAYGNQLIKAAIHTANELRDIWVSLRKREEVRRRKAELELISSYPENSNTLQQNLFHDEDVPLTQDKTTTNPNPLVQNRISKTTARSTDSRRNCRKDYLSSTGCDVRILDIVM